MINLDLIAGEPIVAIVRLGSAFLSFAAAIPNHVANKRCVENMATGNVRGIQQWVPDSGTEQFR